MDETPPLHDEDLEAIRGEADRISAAGVCALVDRLQNYRNTARTLFTSIEELDRRSPQDMTVEALRQRLATMNQHLAELENQFNMDTIDLADLLKDA